MARGEGEFAPLGAPAQFAGGVFGAQKAFVAVTFWIAQAEPDEVGQFVDEDAGKLGTGAVERNTAFAEESSGVHRPAAVAEPIGILYANRIAAQFGEARKDGGGSLTMYGVVEEKKIGGGHPC